MAKGELEIKSNVGLIFVRQPKSRWVSVLVGIIFFDKFHDSGTEGSSTWRVNYARAHCR
jgi:hypothetical protein